MENIKISTSLNIKDYRSLLFQLTYKKPMIIILTLIGLLSVVTSVLYFFGLFGSFSSPPYFQLFLGICIVLFLPFSVYRQANRSFNGNRRLSESITYEFSQEQVSLTGESFSSTYTWDKIPKIEINKKWVLIYQNKTTANIIMRKNFREPELMQFIGIVNSYKSITKKIKQ
jgi:hypothetical protein